MNHIDDSILYRHIAQHYNCVNVQGYVQLRTYVIYVYMYIHTYAKICTVAIWITLFPLWFEVMHR